MYTTHFNVLQCRGKVYKMCIKPTKNLTPLNTYGPISSIPVSCAINVVPQINVHNKALANESDLDIFKELTYKQNLLQDFLLTHYKT